MNHPKIRHSAHFELIFVHRHCIYNFCDPTEEIQARSKSGYMISVQKIIQQHYQQNRRDKKNSFWRKPNFLGSDDKNQLSKQFC